MSPEQYREKPPAYPMDVYAFGALLVHAFTGMEPMYLVEDDRERLAGRLEFLIGSGEAVSLMMDCLHPEPYQRPGWSEITTRLGEYKASLAQKPDRLVSRQPVTAPTPHLLTGLVQAALDSLADDALSTGGLWHAQSNPDVEAEIKPFGIKEVVPGIGRGVAGVIYLLARAKRAGFDITANEARLNATAARLVDTLAAGTPLPGGLFDGTAGIALARTEASTAGLPLPGLQPLEIAAYRLDQDVPGLSVVAGLAGQGLALLQLYPHLAADELTTLLDRITGRIIEAQAKDGSWITTVLGGVEKINGFGMGIAGIVYYLLEYAGRGQSPLAMQAAIRGLAYLEKQAQRERGAIRWPVSTLNKTQNPWLLHGSIGIALPFLKAWYLLQDSPYRTLAEGALRSQPARPLTHALSTVSGLAGLGEIYLEASRVLRTEEFNQRADWIAYLLLQLGRRERGRTQWIVSGGDSPGAFWNTQPTAELMAGNGGVIHFLMRYCAGSGKLSFPLLPG